MPIETFGPFQLLEKLGEGEMSEAFVAVRSESAVDGRRVCVKRAWPFLCSDPETQRMFSHEAEVSRRLTHPHIAQVLSHGRTNGTDYLEVELCVGLSLKELQASLQALDLRLSVSEVVAIARALSSALAAAHDSQLEGAPSPIVHRNVTPSNVLLDPTGAIKLTDFAVAKSLDDVLRTAPGIIKGNVSYMAPEYARTGDLDERCDQFSLGVLLFEAIAARRPHDGSSAFKTLEQATLGRHAPLSQLAPGAPVELVDIVERLILPAPDSRFTSMRALCEALEQLPAGQDAVGALAARVQLFLPEVQRQRRQEAASSGSAAPQLLSSRLALLKTPLQLSGVCLAVALGLLGVWLHHQSGVWLASLSLVVLGLYGAWLVLSGRRRQRSTDIGASLQPKRSTVDQAALLRTYSVELERQNQALREMQAQLAQAEKMASLGALAAGVAHEVNNPIGALSSNVQITARLTQRLRQALSDPTESDRGSAQSLLDSIESLNATNREAAERIARLVVSLRSFAQLDEAERQMADLHEGLDSVLVLLQHTLGDRINVVVDKGQLPEVECYPGELNQAFMKILTNAVEAIDGRGRITIRTWAESAETACRVCVEIRDTGRGMTITTLDRAFDPGFTTKGVRVGTGLGLAIAHRVVQRHGGCIEVDSQPGAGTALTVRLPCRLPVAAA